MSTTELALDIAQAPRDARPMRPPLGRDFLRLWSATAVSSVGDGIRIVAFPLLAASITRNPMVVSGVLVATTLPWLLFSLLSGAIADRVDRRRLVVYVNAARAAVMIGLGIALSIGSTPLWFLFLIAFLQGVGEVFSDNTMFAMVPRLVPRQRLEDANGRLEAAVTAANEFAGPAIGGLLFGVAIAAPFAVDALSFVGAAALVTGIRLPANVRVPEGRPGIVQDIREGVSWLRTNRLLMRVTLIGATTNLVLHATFAIAVLYALEVLGVGAAGFGFLLSVEALGAMLGCLVAARLGRRLGTACAITTLLVIAGLANAGLFSTGSWAIAALLLPTISFSGAAWKVITSSLRQRIVPDDLLGRVQSIHRLVSSGAIPIGALLGGILAGALGTRGPFLVAAVVLCALALATPRLLREAAVSPAYAPAG